MKNKSGFLGMKFTRWLVVGHTKNILDSTYFNCLCDCGTIRLVKRYHLKSGASKSCGCLNKEVVAKRFKTHGMEGTPTYNVWQHILQRCNNTKNKSYKNYGGRGIKVCKRWRNSFENFYSDMGDKPKNKSIDRIDNNGDYKPSNCKWSTAKEQCSNTRKNIKVTIKGKTNIISEGSVKLKGSSSTIHSRLRRGWSIEKAASTPIFSPRKLIAHNKTRTVLKWSVLAGLHRKTIVNRLNQGMSSELAVSSAKYF